ncbi:hypothetical protein [Pseudobacteriovorax antillogorgiicola]|uniref:Response regulatory domain-containing protein n=1 Tax=Pseudobacteriovorax antillogorgiicola TaxID=1513793 RepID=A0A1Y6CGF2_9BACT|nr:hypothetical protein [Pseudobacteriovorax antillogorgiicola]TCS49088.1 hypothetical protein EDD56_116131 [Pseudobacteriovorax antillogorgiicola]SMF51859.1 hypothetical protein SAMN06296036_11623 [Pseudobacteriovorax antillogorgiicola]
MPKKKPFEGHKVLIVSQNDNIKRVLTKVFHNCGAQIFTESDGHQALRAVRKLKTEIVIFSNDVQRGGAKWFAHQLRTKHITDADILWYIGNQKIPLMDGFTRRPFKPVSLVKPLAYNLAVLDDLRRA